MLLAQHFMDHSIQTIDPKTAPGEYTQAQVIFSKFGGPGKLCQALRAIGCKYERSTVYRWNYSRKRGGSEGWIPSTAWVYILKAARVEGIVITPEDMDPRTYMLQKRVYSGGTGFKL